MHSRDYRDIIGGMVLIVIGAGAAIYAAMSLRFGTVTNMGPGMFPAALGMLLAGFGAVILVPAFCRGGDLPEIEWRPLIVVLLAMLAFALIVQPFGMVPAIVVMTLIASRADRKLSPLALSILIVALSLTATLIFQVALGLQLRAFSWPRW